MTKVRRSLIDGGARKTVSRWRLTACVMLVGAVAVGCSADSEISVPAVQPVTVATDASGGVTTITSEPTAEVAQPTSVGETFETGPGTTVAAIPGLDSTIAFCAAWSRFTGSFTLVDPAWALAADPEIDLDVDPAVVEVVASPTMVAAYFDMGKNWPAEIATYQVEGMDYLRPLFDRMNRSFQRLKAAGATESQLSELSAWWEGQLVAFEGDTFPTLAMVPTDLQTVVVTAAEGTRNDEVPMVEDPGLVSSVVNAVSDYLANNCPDRGQLAGEGVADNVSDDEP